ncbi:hypothetical protein AVEN_219865-1, partial [Araneus ventricosus]
KVSTSRFTVYVGLVYIKSDVVGETSSYWCGNEVLRGCGCQFRCRPRHLTTIQNDELLPKMALVLL